jgi:hypothetical protein
VKIVSLLVLMSEDCFEITRGCRQQRLKPWLLCCEKL